MVTTVKLQKGVLTTKREGFSEEGRRPVLGPAIAFLRSRGGGCVYVFSR